MTPFSSRRISVRLAPLGLAVALVASACVSIDPIPSASPTPPVPRPTPSGQPNITPTPTSPGAEPTPTTPGATLEPGATATPTPPDASAPHIDPAVAAEIDAVIEQVPPLRELEALTDVPYEFITRQQFTDQLIELQFSEVPAETIAAEERLYKRLALLPDDADLDELLVDLYGAQVAADLRVPVDRDHGFRWKMITQSGGT